MGRLPSEPCPRASLRPQATTITDQSYRKTEAPKRVPRLRHRSGRALL